MANNNNAKLPDISTLISAGIDPKTGLPAKYTKPCDILKGVKLALRIKDEQDAIMRYTWYNLPDGVNGQLLERILYYKGQVMIFYVKEQNKFYILPYTLNGNINTYNRYVSVSPVVLGNSIDESDKKPIEFIPGLIRKPIYEAIDEDVENFQDIFENGCVLLSDYTEQWAPKIVPRQAIQESLIQVIAEAIPLARTNLLANCGTIGTRVDNETMAWSVDEANKTFYDYAMAGKPRVPITGATEMQELTGSNALKSEEFLMFAQAMDNIRLSMLGLRNGGIFEKKAHMLQSEADLNDTTSQAVLIDGLTNRQRFCDIANSIWGLNIWCELSETLQGIDNNFDGQVGENKDQSGVVGGDLPNEGGTE